MIQKLAASTTRQAHRPKEDVYVRALWETPSAGEYAVWIDTTLSLRLWVVADGRTLRVRAFTPYDDVGWLLLNETVREILMKYPHVHYDMENPIRCDMAAWRE